MRQLTPLQLIGLGFLLSVTGLVIPFLMLMNIIAASFFLSFVSHGASVVGLFLGIIGAAQYVGMNRRQ